MTQSSIEWLMEIDKSRAITIEEWQQAKAMHKEEIESGHIEGQRVFDKFPHTQWTNDQAEQYYNETYKGGEQ